MVILSMAAGLAACGGGSSGGGTSSGGSSPSSEPTTGTGATDAISQVYTQFFSAPVPTAETLIQDGSTLAPAFKAAAKLKGKSTEAAKVKTVKLTGPTTADVTFELDTDGKVTIPSSDGQAVYVNGKWLVAKQTFCTLVELGVPNVKGCS
jgi:hypothetical protein